MQLDHSSSQHAVPSPDGALVASCQQSTLTISNCAGATLRSIPLPSDFISKCRYIRWSRVDDNAEGGKRDQAEACCSWQCSRILLADDDTVRLYDLNDEKWSTVIERAASNFGKIADVAFGHTPNEFLVFSDFGVKLTIWSLVTCRGVEIRDPKYMIHCYSYRPRTGHMAILTRPAAQDILMLLNPGDHTLIESFELPTVDAQEVAWSPDGQWIAIRDAANGGHKVLFYTADGHLFKTYTRDGDTSDIGLGIKGMEWCHSTGLFAIGDYNDNVTMLSRNIFSPIAVFPHPSTISLSGTSIWQEQLSASKERSYITAPQPANPPTSASSSKTNIPAHGISMMTFCSDGSLLVTKSDFAPTTVWIWSMHSSKAVAILIHHSPVKHIGWHPTEPELLLIHCAIPEPVIHLWKSSWEIPRIVNLPLQRASGRLEAHWLQSSKISDTTVMLSSAHQYITARLTSTGDVIPESPKSPEGRRSIGVGAETLFDEGNSFDLSPIKIAHDETIEVGEGFKGSNASSGSGFGFGNEMVDDTFHYRRQVRAAT